MNEDERLIERTLAGEKEAFEMIIRKYQQSLLNYISRMVGERELATDLTQNVFIKSYSALSTYQSQYKFSTWLFKIASNSVIDYWRKRKIDAFSLDQGQARNESRAPLQIPADEPSIVKRFELSELRVRIEKALRKIPPALRELFVWKHINEFSYEEIAEIKGLPVGTIKNKVYQAKEMIRSHLEDPE